MRKKQRESGQPPLVLCLKLELMVYTFPTCPFTVAQTAFAPPAPPEWRLRLSVPGPGLFPVTALQSLLFLDDVPGEASAAPPLEAFQPSP